MQTEGREKTPAPRPAREFGRYHLIGKIAEGGMATVYLAELGGEAGFEKRVAIKVIHPHLAGDDRFAAMFMDEARVASRIHHSNVCQVIDFGRFNGAPYLVMEYLHGVPLSGAMRVNRKLTPLPRPLAARIVAEAARGLHAAHELRDATGETLGVVHRDVSPHNLIVLFEGAVKVLDFGIARAKGRISNTQTGEVKGKYAYMAPEQLRGHDIDRRADVWALGVVLWEATLGRRLFRGEGDSEGSTVLNVLTARISPPTELDPEYPKQLEDILMKTLQRDLQSRMPTAAQLADELENFVYSTGQPCGATQVAEWLKANFSDQAEHQAFSDPPTAATMVSNSEVSVKVTADTDPTNVLSAGADLSGGTLTPPTVTDVPFQKQKRGRLISLVALGAAVLGVGLVWFNTREKPVEQTPITQVAEPTKVEPTKTPEPTKVEPTPTPTTTVAGQPTTPTTSTTTVTAPTTPETNAQTTTAAGEEGTSKRVRGSKTGTKRTGGTKEATTEPETTTTKTAEPPPTNERGTLHLMAIPQAVVMWKGIAIGRTPVIGQELPAGEHTLLLRGTNGEEKRITVNIRPGQATRLTVRLAE